MTSLEETPIAGSTPGPQVVDLHSAGLAVVVASHEEALVRRSTQRSHRRSCSTGSSTVDLEAWVAGSAHSVCFVGIAHGKKSH